MSKFSGAGVIGSRAVDSAAAVAFVSVRSAPTPYEWKDGSRTRLRISAPLSTRPPRHSPSKPGEGDSVGYARITPVAQQLTDWTNQRIS